MNKKDRVWIATVFALMVAAPQAATAGPCDAYFTFDDTLADSSGNGHDGEMIGAKGTSAKATYTEGKFGKALELDGTGAMRALIDLHWDNCPQVTISAWIKVPRDGSDDSKHLLSTGGGSGPGMNVSGSSINLKGTENGIFKPNALRKGSWMFVAGVYDYETGEYLMYWGSRAPMPGKLSQYRYEPQSAFWVGTVHDDWGIFASGIMIDDLRITGRASDAEQVMALRSPSVDRSSELAARTEVVADDPRPDIGDQDRARQLPGDHFEPETTQLPGDQHEPQQIQDAVLDPDPEITDRDDSTKARTEVVID